VDPDERCGEEREEDLDAVVDERRGRAREELAIRLEHAGHERGQAHEDRGQQHDPSELDREGQLLRVLLEPRRHERRHEPRRRDEHHGRERHEREDEDVHHARCDVPRFLLALLRQVAGEDGNERRCQGAGHEKLEEGVGDLERGPEGVQLRGRTEGRPDHGEP
jgi:hypothetical protein